MHDDYMAGKVVSEEEAAVGLGFANVFEMRRWQTELGHKLSELKHQLRTVESDRDNFRWNLKRTLVILDHCREFLDGLKSNKPIDKALLEKLLLGANVVSGHGIDWKHILRDWLPPATKPDDSSAKEKQRLAERLVFFNQAGCEADGQVDIAWLLADFIVERNLHEECDVYIKARRSEQTKRHSEPSQ